MTLVVGGRAPELRVVLTSGATYTSNDEPSDSLLLLFLRHLA